MSISSDSSILFISKGRSSSQEPKTILSMKCPGISVFCSDGAIINGIQAKWKIGTPPSKNWHEIRAEYYKENKFLLGDFKKLARFLAMAGSDISQDAATEPGVVSAL